MSLNLRSKIFAVFILVVPALLVSCVTEVTESPSMKFSDTAIIAVQDPNVHVEKGATIAWLPEAVRYYKDDRLKNTPIKTMIEKEIVKNLLDKEMILVESVNGARYAVAYTAALATSLDDNAIIKRFGLLPGNAQIPTDDKNIEKGSLIVYIFENRSGDVVWRSAAQVSVKFDMSAKEREQRVQRVLAEMFQTFKVL